MKSTLRLFALSLAASAAVLASAHAAQNNGGGPVSTPTWTIGTKPHVAGEEVTIKEKSSTTKSGTSASARDKNPKCPPDQFWDVRTKRCMLKPVLANPSFPTQTN